MLNRRNFLMASTAFVAMPHMRTFAMQAKPWLRIGVLSDIHVREQGSGCAPLLSALSWYDAQKVDGVIMAGDLADSGLAEQLKLVGMTWDKVFPGGRASDGRTVEKLFVTGNHDDHHYNNWFARKLYPDDKERFSHAIAKDFDAVWKDCFRESYEPFSMKTVKGYRFVCRQYNAPAKGIAEFLGNVKVEIEGDRPFFYVQHQHPKDTCYGPWAWGSDNGESTRALSRHPNAVAFSGHSHYSLTDERSIWQGAFTSVGTGTLSVGSTPYGYENGDADSGNMNESAKEMPLLNCKRSSQGMLMDVFDDRIILARHDFCLSGKPKIGPDWTIPLPFAEPAPFAFASRAKTYPVPQFPENAKISVKHVDGEDRKKVKKRQIELVFPAANAGIGRVFDYEVCARLNGSILKRCRLLSPTYNRPPREDAGLVVCCFSAKGISEDVGYSVIPRNCYGNSGKELVT